jgi:hypothetical protein
VPDPDKVVVLTQTTLSVDDTMRTIDILRERFPALVLPPRDDLCYATKNRQDAVKAIAPQVDAFVVVTSTTSSNGMRLLELAETLTGARCASRVGGPRPGVVRGRAARRRHLGRVDARRPGAGDRRLVPRRATRTCGWSRRASGRTSSSASRSGCRRRDGRSSREPPPPRVARGAGRCRWRR